MHYVADRFCDESLGELFAVTVARQAPTPSIHLQTKPWQHLLPRQHHRHRHYLHFLPCSINLNLLILGINQPTQSQPTIRCPVHGDFKQTPTAHIAGAGCPKCAAEGQALTTKEFIKKARSKHEDRYDYTQVKYVNSSTQVTIL